MSLSDKEIEEMFDRLDNGNNEGVSSEVQKDHQLIKEGIQYIQEEAFKEQLISAEKAMNGSSFFNFRFYVTSGIAACLVLALFWYGMVDSPSENIELQMDEVPAYADSASYDSLKNFDVNVDKVK